ncbi:hypothetical protein IM792_10410 [Mucilaginibacter sp. JRF]|uniref:hypothetical protein n=1 Tax=Mucilaginibacter sp. JRF TaxID=2780088 RepID=UPI00187E55FB|nr:hypothetical protein [Mucilaginibacter sp. JRF]MBE9584859.1 hypothetical protein [Mucilaginibacter sp. JRF]
MNKHLALSLLLSTALLGCKKETGSKKVDEPQSDQTHIATFSIQDFSISDGSLSTNGLKTNALKDDIKYLHYGAYRGEVSDYHFALNVHKVAYQDYTQANFGKITDSLTNGPKRVYFVGTQVKGAIGTDQIPGTGGSFIAHPMFAPASTDLKDDMYYAALDTTVSGPINKQIVLKRMVTKVTLKISDPIPSNAAKLVFQFMDYPPTFDLATGTGRPRTREEEYLPRDFVYDVKSADKGKSNFELCVYVWPYRYRELSITCFDKNGKVIATKIMPKNQYDFYTNLEINRHYTFSGYLFGHQATFGVTVDKKWDEPVNMPYSVTGVKRSIK